MYMRSSFQYDYDVGLAHKTFCTHIFECSSFIDDAFDDFVKRACFLPINPNPTQLDGVEEKL